VGKRREKSGDHRQKRVLKLKGRPARPPSSHQKKHILSPTNKSEKLQEERGNTKSRMSDLMTKGGQTLRAKRGTGRKDMKPQPPPIKKTRQGEKPFGKKAENTDSPKAKAIGLKRADITRVP